MKLGHTSGLDVPAPLRAVTIQLHFITKAGSSSLKYFQNKRISTKSLPDGPGTLPGMYSSKQKFSALRSLLPFFIGDQAIL